MKKIFTFLLVIFICFSYICYPQTPEGNTKKVESVQIDYFTKELELKPDESTKFWPIYNNYKNEIKDVRKENKNDPIVLEEKILNIRKKYKNDFKDILGNEERVNKMFVTERNFREILRQELIKRSVNGSKEPDIDD